MHKYLGLVLCQVEKDGGEGDEDEGGEEEPGESGDGKGDEEVGEILGRLDAVMSG